MESQYQDINLDAVLGFHILQGYLRGTLEKWSSAHESLAQHARIESLLRKLSSLIEKAAHFLAQNDPKYFKEFEPVLGPHFWVFPRLWNQTDPLLAYTAFGSTKCLTEEMSDSCLTYLLGTWKESGKSCIVTSTCRNIMTKPGCSDYSLSHQLFYFLFADMLCSVACLVSLTSTNSDGWRPFSPGRSLRKDALENLVSKPYPTGVRWCDPNM
uniref:Uncharacterized protein n=1 Tax=Dromaius novaehollandiae TaxID=8790 RepID=A0A8C4KIB7_DRONO